MRPTGREPAHLNPQHCDRVTVEQAIALPAALETI
jgi:hypothetical protein